MPTNRLYRDDDVLEIVEVTIFNPNRTANNLYGVSSGLFWVQSNGALETDEYTHKFGTFANGDIDVATWRGIHRVKNVIKCERDFDGRWVANSDNSPLHLI